MKNHGNNNSYGKHGNQYHVTGVLVVGLIFLEKDFRVKLSSELNFETLKCRLQIYEFYRRVDYS